MYMASQLLIKDNSLYVLYNGYLVKFPGILNGPQSDLYEVVSKGGGAMECQVKQCVKYLHL